MCSGEWNVSYNFISKRCFWTRSWDFFHITALLYIHFVKIHALKLKFLLNLWSLYIIYLHLQMTDTEIFASRFPVLSEYQFMFSDGIKSLYQAAFLQLNILCMLTGWQKKPLILSFKDIKYVFSEVLKLSFNFFEVLCNWKPKYRMYFPLILCSIWNCLLFKWSYCWLCTLYSGSACVLMPVRAAPADSAVRWRREVKVWDDLTQTLQLNI